MELIELVNPNGNGRYNLKRQNYFIFKCFFSDFSEEEIEIIRKDTKILEEKADYHAANSGEHRTFIIKHLDSFTGIIAEVITQKMFKEHFNIKAERPEVKTTENQIDILLNLFPKQYTVEVRSSMVRNGISFALFNGYKGTPYFDVIGPYCQSNYKKTFESLKDIYIRVLFDVNSFNTPDAKYQGIRDSKLPFYIIGGIQGKTLKQANKTKSMTTEVVENPGTYYYLGIDEILDCKRLKEILK